MTKEKEKAKELVDQYIRLVPEDFGGMDKELAKQCAIICVKNQQLAVETALERHGIAIEFTKLNKYFSDLEKEIENL